jgi:hypothetical protein
LNPAPLVGSSMLAYLDPLVVWPLAGALVTASGGWPFVSGALFAVAAATKAQGLFALPAVALAVWCGARADDRLRSLWRCAAAALAAVAAIVAPIAAVGSLGNLLAALESLARHDMLSANAPNLWWIVAYLLRGWYAKANMGTWAAFTTPTRILGISRTMELGYPNPRLVGAALTMAAMCWALWTARRTRDRLMLVGVGAFMVHAYATLSAQVHENHLYAAIPLMIFAAAGHPRLRPVMWTVSLVFAVNLNAFYGISEYIEGWAISRTITVIDLTVLLAAVNCAALVWHAQVLRRECRETQTDTARLNSLPPVARLIRIIS